MVPTWREDWRAYAPRLDPSNCEGHSPPTMDYNCLAFAAGETHRWWEPYVFPPTMPGIYWPAGVEPDNTVPAWCEALATVGFERCHDGAVEAGVVKVAVFARGDTATHAARQRRDGRWVSKLGDDEDIVHDAPHHVGGLDYGEVACFLARSRRPDDD